MARIGVWEGPDPIQRDSYSKMIAGNLGQYFGDLVLVSSRPLRCCKG
jgi:hypothetical protein